MVSTTASNHICLPSRCLVQKSQILLKASPQLSDDTATNDRVLAAAEASLNGVCTHRRADPCSCRPETCGRHPFSSHCIDKVPKKILVKRQGFAPEEYVMTPSSVLDTEVTCLVGEGRMTNFLICSEKTNSSVRRMQ